MTKLPSILFIDQGRSVGSRWPAMFLLGLHERHAAPSFTLVTAIIIHCTTCMMAAYDSTIKVQKLVTKVYVTI